MILGIDFGSSNTDFVLLENKKVIQKEAVPAKENPIHTLEKFPLNEIEEIKVTGAYSKTLSKNLCKYNIPIKTVDEISAIGLGGSFVSNSPSALIVSLGSGTCLVSVKKNQSQHIGGTGIGGKTLLGLSKLLLSTDSLEEIQSLASNGNLENANLMLKEIYPEGVGLLSEDVIASNFGSLKNPQKSDIALSLLVMIAQAIATIAAFAAKAHSHKKIIFTGKLSKIPIIKSSLSECISLFNKEAEVSFPENSDIATAIGAAVSQN